MTSGTPELALGRLRRAGIPAPAVLVFAGDAARGKPARAAGCQVVAVAHTHTCAELREADACFAGLPQAVSALGGR